MPLLSYRENLSSVYTASGSQKRQKLDQDGRFAALRRDTEFKGREYVCEILDIIISDLINDISRFIIVPFIAVKKLYILLWTGDDINVENLGTLSF